MKKISKLGLLKIAASMCSLAAVVVATGFGCGMGFQAMNKEISNGFDDFGSNDPLEDNNDLMIISNTKTVGITNYTSVLDAMSSMTNVAPSNQTRDVFEQKLASFAETKSALAINAPMLMAYIALGAEVCNDLINSENSLPAANRRFFTGTNLNLAANNNAAPNISEAMLNDWIRRFARQFWQRNETPEELQMIKAGITGMRTATPVSNNGLTRKIALYTCTSAISATSSYEI